MSSADSAHAPFSFVLSDHTRILVIDDDPIQTEFAAVYLATPSAVVETAPTAEAGLRMLAANPYDVALVDIDLPGMNGIDMVRAIRSNARTKSMTVVMVTGFEDIVSIDQSYEAGATSFITKPVNWRLLSYHLRFLLRARRCEGETQVSCETHRSPPVVTPLARVAEGRASRPLSTPAAAMGAPTLVSLAAATLDG